MNCYLCAGVSHSVIKDRVRDRQDIQVLKCNNCGLVFLDKTAHIDQCFYEQGGMARTNRLGAITVTSDTIDTEKRFNLHNKFFQDKCVLDFGCGNGSLLKKIKESGIARELLALEPDKACRDFLHNDFRVYSSIEEVPEQSVDVITLFHVLEHLKDPVETLNLLHSRLADGGTVIIEVPSSTDALLHLYNCGAFSDFTYWSCHLYLFDCNTLEALLEKTPFKISSIRQYQRYTLANHLHWLAKGKPAGHVEWGFLDDEDLNARYAEKLAEIGMSDSLIAVINN